MIDTLEERGFSGGGKRFTAFGFGGAVITNESHAEGVATVRAALDAGITYYDTSPGYCDNESQVVLGEGLEGRHDDIVVATKVGYFSNPADFRNPEAIRRQIDDNLRRLRRDHVDLLQVHEANWSCWWVDGAGREQIDPEVDYPIEDAPVFEALLDAKERGLCDRIGITGNVAPQIATVLRSAPVDTVLIAFNYHLMSREADEHVTPVARERGVDTIIGAIFGAGRYVVPHPEWVTERPKWMDADTAERYAQLLEVYRESGLSLLELSIRYCLETADAVTVLIGVKNRSELSGCLEAASAGRLPRDIKQALDRIGGSR